MQGVEHRGESWIGPIDGQCILREVVRPHRQEVGTVCQRICDQRAGGGFDHDTEPHLSRVTGFGAQPIENVAQFIEFACGGDHGGHDVRPSRTRRPQDRAKLGFQKIGKS